MKLCEYRWSRSFLYQIFSRFLYVLCFTRPRYQVSVYRTIGPLVRIIWPRPFKWIPSVYIVFRNMEHYPSAITNYPPYLIRCNFSYQWLRISLYLNVFLGTIDTFANDVKTSTDNNSSLSLCSETHSKHNLMPNTVI